MSRATTGSVYRTAARLALVAGLVAAAVCAWEVVSVRDGSASAQAAATAAQNDAAAAQAITSLQLAELNNVIEPTATSQRNLVALGKQTRERVSALAIRIAPDAPSVAARLRVEVQLLDAQIRKLVAATAASDGQAVVDTNGRVQQLATDMRAAVDRQQQIDSANARSNLQRLRSSRPAVIGLLVAILGLGAAAAITLRLRRDSVGAGVPRAGDRPAARGGPS